MKIYDVTVTVYDEKTFSIVAENEKEAREKTAQIYAQTDLLDFNSEDLVPRIEDVREVEDVDEEDYCDGDCDHCPFAVDEDNSFLPPVQKTD